VESFEQRLGRSTTLVEVVAMVDRAEPLCCLPGHGDLAVGVTDQQRRVQPANGRVGSGVRDHAAERVQPGHQSTVVSTEGWLP